MVVVGGWVVELFEEGTKRSTGWLQRRCGKSVVMSDMGYLLLVVYSHALVLSTLPSPLSLAPRYANSIVPEHTFFEKNPTLGEMVYWETIGDASTGSKASYTGTRRWSRDHHRNELMLPRMLGVGPNEVGLGRFQV